MRVTETKTLRFSLAPPMFPSLLGPIGQLRFVDNSLIDHPTQASIHQSRVLKAQCYCYLSPTDLDDQLGSRFLVPLVLEGSFM